MIVNVKYLAVSLFLSYLPFLCWICSAEWDNLHNNWYLKIPQNPRWAPKYRSSAICILKCILISPAKRQRSFSNLYILEKYHNSMVVIQTVFTNLTLLCDICCMVCSPSVTHHWLPVILGES